MAHDVRSPHIFQDGPGNGASGEQVMDNLDVLWAKIDTYEPAFASYKTILERGSAEIAAQVAGAGTYPLTVAGTAAPISSNAVAFRAVFYYDPADFTAGARSTKLRLRTSWAQNAQAPNVANTVGLYPVSAVSGGAVTLGTVVSGSTAAFGPSGNTLTTMISGDFTAPAAGYYVIAFAAAGAWTPGAEASIAVQLQVRQV